MKLENILPHVLRKKKAHNAVGDSRPKKTLHGIGVGMGYWLTPPPQQCNSMSGEAGGDGGGDGGGGE